MAFLAGQLITASALNALAGAAISLDTDFPKTSDTTFANTGLALPLEANSKYLILCELAVDANTTADAKYNFLLPAGATIVQSIWGSGAAVGAGVLDGTIFHDRVAAASLPVGGVNSGTVITFRPWAVVRTTGTAGNVTLQFAQNTSNATASILKFDSCMRAIKL